MLKLKPVLLTVAIAGLTSVANAAVTVRFDSTECPGCSSVSPVTNEWNSFGLTISNAYWYIDSRDPFDTMGLSIQTSPSSISLATASTNATIEYFVLEGYSGFYEAFDSAHSSLGSFTSDATSGQTQGSYTFNGLVSSIEWAGEYGRAQISTLTLAPVPEPEAYAMLMAGLGLLGFVARRKNKVQAIS